MKLLIVLTLCATVLSCNGQEKMADLKKNEIASHDSKSKDVLAQNQNIQVSSQAPNSNNQISQVVRTIFQDSRGDIWFGSEGGAFRLRGKSLTHIDKIKSERGRRVTIKDITEDRDGKIWLGHTDGISSIDGDSVTNYYETDGLISNDVWCITADSKGKIWVGTIAGICVYDGHTFTNFKLPEGKIDTTLGVSSTRMVHNIIEDNKGTLWLSSNAGLFSYSNNLLINVSNKIDIQTNFVNEVFEDKKGTLWISTKKDLYRFKDNELTNITKDKIVIGKGIGSIAEDKKGNIWFTSNQHDLQIYDGEQITEYQKSEDNKGPVIFQIYKDQADRLWFVGYGGAYRLKNGKFLNVTQNGPW